MTNRDDFDNFPTDDDDDSLDWLSDDSLFEDTASSAKQGDSTGFTGELPWMQDDDEQAASDDDELAWLTDDEPAATAEGGIGHDLDWGGVNIDSDHDESWLAEDEKPAPKEWQSPRPDLVDSEFERQMEAAEVADFGDTADDLDWLNEPEAETPAGGLDLPDWMSGLDVPEVSEADLAAAHASVADTSDDDEDLSWLDDDSAEAEEDLGWLGGSEDEQEESVSFSSLLGGSDTDEEEFTFASSTSDDDEEFSFASSADDDDEEFAFASSAGDDNEDLSFLGSSSSDDDEEIMPAASQPSGTDSMWGELGAGFTQEMASVEEEDKEPVDTGWNLRPDTEPDRTSLQSPAAEADMDEAFAAMFPEDEEAEVDEPDWMQDIQAPQAEVEAVAADDSAGELDDLLAQLDTGADSGDVDDLLAQLDVAGDADVDMDDLLAELEGMDTGTNDLDDLLAQVGETKADADEDYDDFLAQFNADDEIQAEEEYDDAVDPATFHTGITDMFDTTADDDLEFLSETEAESEVDADDEYDDMPLAFDTGVNEMFDAVNSDELDFLLSIEEETGGAEDYEDAVDPLAFHTGITDLLAKPSEEELDLLTQMEEDLAADAEYDDTVEPLAFDTGLTDLMESINTQDLEAIDSQLEEDDAAEPLAFDSGLTDLLGGMHTGDLEAIDSQLQPDDDLDFDFLADLEEASATAEPAAPAEELDLDFDFGDTDEPAAAAEEEFDFSFGGEVEEVQTPAPSVGKRDSGLLKRATDDLSDLGLGEDADWLAALDDAIEGEEIIPETPKARESELNVADLLGSLEALDSYQVEEDEDFVPIQSDLDDIFDEYDLESLEEEDDVLDEEDLPEGGEIPEWLREVTSGKGDKYEASKVIREMKDRSLEELDERLLELRERGLEITSEVTDTEADRQRLVKLVPNIGETLVAAKVLAPEAAVLTTEPRLSNEQLKRAELLRSIVGEAVETDAGVRPARRRRLRLPLGRWLIVLLLGAAIMTPFFISDFNVSDTPAATFNGDVNDGSGLWAYQNINNLQHGDLVLFAVEYGATGARELDSLTEALLTHILHQGARPVIVSSDAIGSLRAESIAARLAGAEGYNYEYYVAGFLPGGNLGLRDLTENLNLVVADNTNGQATNLGLNSLNDFKTIVLIAEGGETVRDWMEQVVPETTTPLIVAIGQSARPVAQSYVDAYIGRQVIALLVGYPDSVTYQSMLIEEYGYAGMPSRTPVPTETTVPPTDTPQPTATTRPTNTPRPTAETTREVELVPPIEKTEEAAEAEPTRERPSATAEEPTEEPSPTTEATIEEEMVEVATVKSTGTVNVREGPGAGFNVINTVEPNQRVRVIGRNDAGDWLNIILPDGSEAWIAAFLTEVELVPESEAESLHKSSNVRYLRQQPRDMQQANTETQTPTATPEPLVNVGRNVSGATIDVFETADLDGTPLEDLSANTQFVVLEQTDSATQILMIDGRTGWVETRVVQVEQVPLSESGFDATNTPTPSSTPTVTLTPTATSTVTPTATPFTPDVFPQQLTDVDARWNAMTLGLLASILLIFVGNVYWIIRWLRRRGE